MRTETPIYVAEAVFDQAGIVSPQGMEAGEQGGSGEAESEVDESKLTPFKEFIETLDIDDLDAGGGESRR